MSKKYFSPYKICSKCQIVKPRDDFYTRKNSKGERILRESTCKICTNEKHRERVSNWTEEQREHNKKTQRKWESKNPIQHRTNVRRSDLKNKYNLTLDQFNEMVKLQNNVCDICKKPEENRDFLSVDHCHKSGKVRGLLCAKCNKALGGFKDCISNLENAINYLKKNNND